MLIGQLEDGFFFRGNIGEFSGGGGIRKGA